MKQLTKEQLTEMVYENCKKVTELNSVNIGERISNFIFEGSEDSLVEIVLKFAAIYGAEIKKECCNILVETIYGVLYNE